MKYLESGVQAGLGGLFLVSDGRVRAPCSAAAPMGMSPALPTDAQAAFGSRMHLVKETSIYSSVLLFQN